MKYSCHLCGEKWYKSKMSKLCGILKCGICTSCFDVLVDVPHRRKKT